MLNPSLCMRRYFHGFNAQEVCHWWQKEGMEEEPKVISLSISLGLKELKSKMLRFIAASHLQTDDFESVLKCVRVLRDGDGDSDNHPSLSVLAMKAWLGIGRFEEAEKEFKRMVINKGIPEAVWVSAVELYFQAVGTAGAETAKGIFLGLLGRCHVSANAASRVVHRVIGDGVCSEGSMVRAKVVAELVSDDRVIAIFARDAAKERTAMHSLLWNWSFFYVLSNLIEFIEYRYASSK